MGEQVADARRHLEQAGQQLRRRGPPPSEGEASADQPDARAAPEIAESSPEGELVDANEPSASEAANPAESDAPQPTPSEGEGAEGDASESMRRAAESLLQAARQLGMAPSPSAQQGERESDPAKGAPGSQSGSSGEDPISLVELEAELRKMATRNCGQLPGQVESELFQSTQRKPEGEYARLIRWYFEEISRRRSAEEGLDPNDNEL